MHWTQFLIGLVVLIVHFEQIREWLERINLGFFIQTLSLHNDALLLSLSKFQVRLEKEISMELVYLIFSYLSEDLLPLSCVSRYFNREVKSYIIRNNEKIISSLGDMPYPINGIIFLYFFDLLQLNFPHLRTLPIEIKDLIGLCDLCSTEFEQSFASDCLKEFIKFKDNDFRWFCSMSDVYSRVAFSHGLFFTSVHLLSTGKISQLRYYENTVRLLKGEGQKRFFEKALEFDNPFKLLERQFNSCFALLLYASSDEEMKQNILSLTVKRMEHFDKLNEKYAIELVREIAKQPELLDKAFANHNFGNGLKCLLLVPTEEQLLATEEGPHWLSLRYLIQMEALDIEEFHKNVPFSLDAVSILPLLNLNAFHFFDAFLHLISGHDFSDDSAGSLSDLQDCCAKSLVPEYLWLLKNVCDAPVKNFNYFSSYTYKLKREVASNLSLLDLMTFHPRSDWSVLKPILHTLDISQPVYVDYRLIFNNCYPYPKRFAVESSGVEAWPPLFLAVATHNLGAVEAILTHPKFWKESKNDRVAGDSFEAMVWRLNHFSDELKQSFANELNVLISRYLDL